MVMKAGEYGIVLYGDTEYDLTGYTAITLTVKRPKNTSFSVTPTVGTSDVVVNGRTFLADKHFTYTTLTGQFPDAGDYTLKLTVQFGAPKRVKSQNSILHVLP